MLTNRDWGIRELLFNGYRVSVWAVEKLLEVEGGDGFITCVHACSVMSDCL